MPDGDPHALHTPEAGPHGRGKTAQNDCYYTFDKCMSTTDPRDGIMPKKQSRYKKRVNYYTRGSSLVMTVVRLLAYIESRVDYVRSRQAGAVV